MKMPSFDIHDGRAFAIACIFVAICALAWHGKLDVEFVKYLATTAMGYLFGQQKGGTQ